MASKAILRRKRFISSCLDAYPRSVYSVRSIHSLLHGNTLQDLDSRNYSSHSEVSSANFGQSTDKLIGTVEKEELISFPRFTYLKQTYGTSLLDLQRDQNVGISSLRLGGKLCTVRSASTVAAQQREIGNGKEGDEDRIDGKKRKEASPEDCDEAVADLSSARAKAKAKQSLTSQKESKSILHRVWAILLGIGPALRAVASMSRADWAKKLKHWRTEFVSTLQHYWLGTKLLWADVRICSRLLFKLADGKSLSRREKQQLTRTAADIFRLVPFAVFIIVPFMEFLLPVFLKLFPNMLPSTFQDKMKEQEALKRKIKARMEYAKFLQDTVREMAREVQNSRSGETKKTAEDLDEFLNKVRTGETVSNDEILGFAKLFNDELTLDNISRPRLVSMCKYMGISPYGTDAYLRFMLRKRLQRIKEDDKLIQSEGVESLSEAELREDCRERGMLGVLSIEEMRQQLRDWLDLSLNHSVPSSLLILSRSFTVSGRVKPEEAVGATLSSLPDEVVDTVGITSLPSEDSVSERRRKLEYLAMQEELIKEEEEKEEGELSKIKDSQISERDVALEEMIFSTARDAKEQARARTVEKREDLCELSRALAVLASASSVSREREEFLQLVNKEIELYNKVVDKEGANSEKQAMEAYRAAREETDETAEVSEQDPVSSALMDKVGSMLQNLEKEIDNVDAAIGDRWRLLDRDYDGKVTAEEVAAAATYLKNTLSKEGIQELVSSLSKDKDGKILVEDIVRLGSQTDDAHVEEEEGSRG